MSKKHKKRGKKIKIYDILKTKKGKRIERGIKMNNIWIGNTRKIVKGDFVKIDANKIYPFVSNDFIIKTSEEILCLPLIDELYMYPVVVNKINTRQDEYHFGLFTREAEKDLKLKGISIWSIAMKNLENIDFPKPELLLKDKNLYCFDLPEFDFSYFLTALFFSVKLKQKYVIPYVGTRYIVFFAYENQVYFAPKSYENAVMMMRIRKFHIEKFKKRENKILPITKLFYEFNDEKEVVSSFEVI